MCETGAQSDGKGSIYERRDGKMAKHRASGTKNKQWDGGGGAEFIPLLRRDKIKERNISYKFNMKCGDLCVLLQSHYQVRPFFTCDKC